MSDAGSVNASHQSSASPLGLPQTSQWYVSVNAIQNDLRPARWARSLDATRSKGKLAGATADEPSPEVGMPFFIRIVIDNPRHRGSSLCGRIDFVISAALRAL
jgi:hypothetical protein